MKALILHWIVRILHRPGQLENGCIWDGHPIRVEDKIEGKSGSTFGPFLICDRCQTIDTLETDPPAGHPDSMTRELAPETEQALAALDRELFPQEAI